LTHDQEADSGAGEEFILPICDVYLIKLSLQPLGHTIIGYTCPEAEMSNVIDSFSDRVSSI
jgi:hypothetical protein